MGIAARPAASAAGSVAERSRADSRAAARGRRAVDGGAGGSGVSYGADGSGAPKTAGDSGGAAARGGRGARVGRGGSSGHYRVEADDVGGTNFLGTPPWSPDVYDPHGDGDGGGGGDGDDDGVSHLLTYKEATPVWANPYSDPHPHPNPDPISNPNRNPT